MNKNSSKIIWITRTAIFIALLIIIQVVTKPAGQFVTGSLVNLILITAALTSGLYSGLTVGLVSPFFAFMLGIGPTFIQLVPFIALGNMAYVLIVYLLVNKNISKKSLAGYAFSAGGIIIGAIIKFLLLWFGIVKVVLPMMTQINEKQLAVLSSTFSWPQLVTALIGGMVALPVVVVVRKAISKNKNTI